MGSIGTIRKEGEESIFWVGETKRSREDEDFGWEAMGIVCKEEE